MNRARMFVMAVGLMLGAFLAYALSDGAWLQSVPMKDHGRSNPYGESPDAVAAGRNIFEEHCVKCHGEDAQGTKKRPSLRTSRVQNQATPGDIHWLLINGNMKKGMPSWAKLPDPQIWQVISYVKSLHE